MGRRAGMRQELEDMLDRIFRAANFLLDAARRAHEGYGVEGRLDSVRNWAGIIQEIAEDALELLEDADKEEDKHESGPSTNF